MLSSHIFPHSPLPTQALSPELLSRGSTPLVNFIKRQDTYLSHGGQAEQTIRTQTTYLQDSTGFTKIMYPYEASQRSGQMSKEWTRRRIMNEANAINLVRQYTTVPVPEVIISVDHLLECGSSGSERSYAKTSGADFCKLRM